MESGMNGVPDLPASGVLRVQVAEDCMRGTVCGCTLVVIAAGYDSTIVMTE
jgi:hypothetical protein